MGKLMTEKEVASMLGCSVHKLRRDRWAGGGVPFVKLADGGSVRYRPEDIEAFVTARLRRSTSDQGGRS